MELCKHFSLHNYALHFPSSRRSFPFIIIWFETFFFVTAALHFSAIAFPYCSTRLQHPILSQNYLQKSLSQTSFCSAYYSASLFLAMSLFIFRKKGGMCLQLCIVMLFPHSLKQFIIVFIFTFYVSSCRSFFCICDTVPMKFSIAKEKLFSSPHEGLQLGADISKCTF